MIISSIHRSARLTFVSVAALASSLVACNGQNVEPEPVLQTCAPPGTATVSLAYPAPQSTAIPASFTQVIVASSTALPNTYYAYLTSIASPGPADSFNVLQTPAPNTPTPQPFAVPNFANPSYYISTNPGTVWPAGATVNVYLAQNTGCIPALLLGTFQIATPSP
jgi:hypothetical protein